MRWIGLILALVIALPATAQDCGNGLPCGPIPWDLPQFPDLDSPTPADYSSAGLPAVTVAPSPTAAATGFITPTPFLDTNPFTDNVATLAVYVNATNEPVYNASGTPMALDDTIASNGSTFFSYAKGFTSNSFGPFAPLMDFILFVFIASLIFALSRMILPVLAALFGVIRKIVQFILDFIPF